MRLILLFILKFFLASFLSRFVLVILWLVSYVNWNFSLSILFFFYLSFYLINVLYFHIINFSKNLIIRILVYLNFFFLLFNNILLFSSLFTFLLDFTIPSIIIFNNPQGLIEKYLNITRYLINNCHLLLIFFINSFKKL